MRGPVKVEGDRPIFLGRGGGGRGEKTGGRVYGLNDLGAPGGEMVSRWWGGYVFIVFRRL
jgi:hypothetical protein